MSGFTVGAPPPANSGTQSGLWRPPGWSTQPQLNSITVKKTETVATGVTTSDLGSGPGSPVTTTTTPPKTKTTTTTYFFDAVLSVDHYSSLRLTDHPVQSGQSIVDHAYALPKRVVMEIGMSDAMDSFVTGQYTSSGSNSSKSPAAFQKFTELQESRLPLTLNTHLKQYDNMLVEEIRAADTSQTVAGLKATIVFRQIKLATVATDTFQANQSSARPDQSIATNEGSLQPFMVDPVMQAGHTSPPTKRELQPPVSPNPIWNSDSQAPIPGPVAPM